MRTELNNKRANIMQYYETKPPTSINVELTYITPNLASNYLRFNDKNRKPSDRHVSFLAKQMKDGLFLENGESIVFDYNGILNDGQHRLLAIVESGKSYWIPIVRGVKPKSMATYDTGKNRTAGDVLGFNGFKYSTNIAAFIQKINKYSTKSSRASSWQADNRKDSLTNQQVLSFCQDNYEWLEDLVRESMLISDKSKPRVLTSNQISVIAYMIGGSTPSEDVYEFLKHLTGVCKTEGTAPLYIYTKLYNSKINKEPLNFYWLLGMSIKAWNYYSDGNPSVKYFKFSIDQELPIVNKQ